MNVCLLGPIWGDICGVPYEFNPQRDPAKIDLAHPRQCISDDTVLTLAVAKAILEQRPYGDTIFELACRYPNSGFGGRFYRQWIRERRPEPYNSFGNGSAMRVAPVGWAFDTVEQVLEQAKRSAECSHNHPLGIAIAQATALAIFLARKGNDKEEIRAALEARFGWDLFEDLAAVRAQAAKDGFDETYRSVPPAIGVFLHTDTFEDCLVQSIALGCDADTQAAIACSIAEAYYGPDETLAPRVRRALEATPDLLRIFDAFAAKYGV